MGVLTVYLDKVTNVADKDLMGKSDPYVLFNVKKERIGFDKDFGENRSSTKGGTINPEYGETFKFTLPDLDNMVLRCKVMDDDPLKDDKLGFAKVHLEGLGLSSDPIEVVKVVDNNIFTKDGKIHLQISWEE